MIADRRSYGWIKDKPDNRDYSLTLPQIVLPGEVDLRPLCSPIVDQGQLGSCTANAIAGALEFDQIKQQEPLVPVSRLFIYYNERVIEGTVGNDSGAQIRNGVKSVATTGYCAEADWPYVIDRYAQQPPNIAYVDAGKTHAYQYRKVAIGVTALKTALAAGYPVVFGFTVYDSFESDIVAHSGVVPLPHRGESVLGGHAVVAVGYNTAHKQIYCRNSWGTGWGASGYFFMPEAYFTPQLTSDFWTITRIS